jgi:acid phosphatase family membrane protein YuiD
MRFGLSYSLSMHSRFISGQYEVRTCSMPVGHAGAVAAALAGTKAAGGADASDASELGSGALATVITVSTSRDGASLAEQAGATVAAIRQLTTSN